MKGPIDREPVLHGRFDARKAWAPVDEGLSRPGGETGLEPLED